MLEEFMLLIEEFRTTVFDLNVFCGIIAGIIVFVFELKCMQTYKKKDRKKEEAIKNGHVIKAKRIGMWADWTSDQERSTSYYHAKYQYAYDGKSHVYRYIGRTYPPNEIELYYRKNPQNVWSDFEKKNNPLAIFLYLFPIAVIIIVINILNSIVP